MKFPILEVDDQADELEDRAQSRTHRHHSLKNCVVTRWNSSYVMICSILDLLTQVNEVLKSIGKWDLIITATEQELLEELRDFLAPFKDFTELVSGYQSNLGLIIMIRQEIETLVNKVKKTEHPAIREAKVKIKAKLNDRL